MVADLPFGSYEEGANQALATATRFMKEAGSHAVKLEGGVRVVEQIRKLVAAGIPVMGHIGFTPQSEHALGGYRVQGRGDDAADTVLADAHAVAEAGAFAIVLEMVPVDVAERVTAELAIPTVGIGAGPSCDAQVLVWQDMLGPADRQAAPFRPPVRRSGRGDGRGRRALRRRRPDRRLPGPGAHLRRRVVVRVATSVAELDAVRAELLAGTTPRPHLAFVPTMGALHEGHLSLVRLARGVADLVVMSIFVNPLQFGPNEDYARYPRTLDVDLARAEQAGVDVVFTPSVAEIYPAGRQVSVSAGPIGDLLEGAVPARPLRRGADRGAQAAQHRAARHRRLRPQGRPAAGLHPPDGARSQPGDRPSSARRSSGSPTAWRCPAATASSARPSAAPPWS